MLLESGKPLSTDPSLTLTEYAPRWLAVAAVKVRPTSLVRYRRTMQHLILPYLGLDAVSQITQTMIRDWIARLMGGDTPRARSTAAGALLVMSQVMEQAVDEGIARENPCKGMPKKLRLTSNAIGRDTKAMSAGQLSLALKTAETTAPQWAFAYRILALTGLRLGEAFGLRWEDVDEQSHTIRVERQVREDGVVAEPKTHQGLRTIDVPEGLLQALRAARTRRTEEGMAQGLGGPGPWILMPWTNHPSKNEVVAARNAIRYYWRATLERARLPEHYTIHCLRHTFASLHLERGENVKWVSEQLGHRSISITVDIYGRWLRTTSRNAADALEALVANS